MVVSWAIHNGKVEATKQEILHTLWFKDIGLPSSGPGFDRVTRGTLRICNDKIRIDVYAGAGNPDMALEYMNTIMDKSGLSDDARAVEMFLQGDCLSVKIA